MSSQVYISITEMVRYMNSGKPFSLVYVTWDQAKGSGGVVKEVAVAYKHYSNAVRAHDAKVISTTQPASLKNPNHFSNSTLNIKIPGQAGVDIRKVHIQLIRQFNGAIVK